MVNNQQQGSAHIIVIIILIVGIVGLLGFVFWQHFINKPVTTDSASDIKDTSQASTKPATYSFQYPQDWKLNSTDSTDDSSVQTANYEENISFGVKQGAIVTVSVSSLEGSGYHSLDAYVDGLKEESYNTDIQSVTVNGVEAYQGQTNYEGERLWTVIIKNNMLYTINYEYADKQAYKSGYDMVVQTFKFR